MSATSAEFTLTIKVGPLDLDCRAFGAMGKAGLPALRIVHTRCNTPVEEMKNGKVVQNAAEAGPPVPEQDGAEKTESKPPTKVKKSVYCPTCRRPLNYREVGWAIETKGGLVLLTSRQRRSLEVKPSKEAYARFIRNDAVLSAATFGRRLFLVPSASERAEVEYAKAYHVLQMSNTVAYINPLVVDRDTRVAIVRPITIPTNFFGKEIQILVLDYINDLDLLKNPVEISGYAGLASVNTDELAGLVREARSASRRLPPTRC